MATSHLYRVLQDPAGNILLGASVSICNPGTTSPIPDQIYADEALSNPLGNPYLSTNGEVDVYFAAPRTVAIKADYGGNSTVIDYIEVVPPAPTILAATAPLIVNNDAAPGLVLTSIDLNTASWQPGGAGSQGPPGPTGNTGAQGAQGPPGSQGAPGQSVQIKGVVATPASLPGSGNTTGDGYITSNTGHLWVWSGSAWVDVGAVQGPAGPTGPQGLQGIAGNDGSPGLAGPTGPAGVTGAQGPQGIQGIQGVQGPGGATGPGVPTGGLLNQVLAKRSATNYDTQWVTNPFLADSGWQTSKTGFSGLNGGAISTVQYRIIGPLVSLYVFGTMGQAIPASATGDYGNLTVAQCPSLLVPLAAQVLSSGPSGPAFHGYISTTGTLVISSGPNNVAFAVNQGYSLGGIYLI